MARYFALPRYISLTIGDAQHGTAHTPCRFSGAISGTAAARSRDVADGRRGILFSGLNLS